MELFISICMGIGLAASSGFRIFIPLLAANIAALTGLHQFSGEFEWLNGWLAFYILLAASIAEIVAYYIPWLDNVLDHLAIPLAVAAGTLLSASFISADWQPAFKWALALLAGGGTAGIIHSGMGLLRLGSTATTAGFANPVVTTAENSASIGFSALALLVPVLMLVIAVILVGYTIRKLVKIKSRQASQKYVSVNEQVE